MCRIDARPAATRSVHHYTGTGRNAVVAQRGQQLSPSLTAPKSICEFAVMVEPAGTFWVQTSQFRSRTC